VAGPPGPPLAGPVRPWRRPNASRNSPHRARSSSSAIRVYRTDHRPPMTQGIRASKCERRGPGKSLRERTLAQIWWLGSTSSMRPSFHV
jgi:hypothetical protein